MQRIADLKKYFLYTMIGSLVAGALVAATSVLIGTFNDTTAKIIWSLVIIVIHSLISFYVINDDTSSTMLGKFKLFNDVIFVLLIASFITALFSIWGLYSPTLTAQLYGTYLVIGVTSLQLNTYLLLQGKNKQLDLTVHIGSMLAIIFSSLLVVFIFGADTWLEESLEMYGRILGAIGILNGSTTIIAAVLYKIHLQKHPNEQNVLSFNTKMNIGRFLLYLIGFFILLNIVGAILSALLFTAF